MISEDDWEKLEKIIRENHKFIISTHINPDGDGLGSELGICRLLEKLGKDSVIINDSPTPEFFKFLDPDGKLIKRYEEKYRQRILESDIIFLMDISNMERLGRMDEVVKSSRATKVCIDHHYSNIEWSDLNIVDELASASGEIVFDLVNRMGFEIDEKMALSLYVAILTDTGSFRFSNTTPRAHIICAELLKKGIKPREIFGYIYESYSWERMMLFSKSLTTLKKIAGGKAVAIQVSKEMMMSSGAKIEDIEGFVEYITAVKDVEIAALFLELPENKIKVSLRSKEKYDVYRIAEIFGGGGHKNASGILMKDYTLQKAEDEVLSEIEKVIK